MFTENGFDISEHNGDIDFKKAKATNDFVIIRAGYGRAIEYPTQYDKYFDKNYNAAKSAGLKVGAYWYSYATNANEARQEAQAFLKAVSGKQFEYPLYFDIEESKILNMGMSVCDPIAQAFCREIEKAEYYAGIYCSSYWTQKILKPETIKRFTLWIADWTGTPINKNIYPTCEVNQYTNSKQVYDFKYCDGNICNTDFTTIMKTRGKNGFNKTDKTITTTYGDKLIHGSITYECISGQEIKIK